MFYEELMPFPHRAIPLRLQELCSSTPYHIHTYYAEYVYRTHLLLQVGNTNFIERDSWALFCASEKIHDGSRKDVVREALTVAAGILAWKMKLWYSYSLLRRRPRNYVDAIVGGLRDA